MLSANRLPAAPCEPLSDGLGCSCARIHVLRQSRQRSSLSERRPSMTMHPQACYLIPAETERVAHAAFPKASPIMRIRDELGMLFPDSYFTALFPQVGQLAISPSRLMLVTLFQFLEGLGDRQAADAVRRCIDWKY